MCQRGRRTAPQPRNTTQSNRNQQIHRLKETAVTVRHIVSWKMNGETAEARKIQATEIAEALRALPATVPGIAAFDVRLNEFNADANWDLVLVSDHHDQEALDTYATHPDHLEVVSLVKARAASRAGVDFEL